MKSPAPLAVGATLVTALLAVGGCASDPNDVSFNAIKSNLTPELMTMTERPVDVERNIAVVWNQNLRNAWNDLGRVFYWDQPSSLTPYALITTSGQPR